MIYWKDFIICNHLKYATSISYRCSWWFSFILIIFMDKRSFLLLVRGVDSLGVIFSRGNKMEDCTLLNCKLILISKPYVQPAQASWVFDGNFSTSTLDHGSLEISKLVSESRSKESKIPVVMLQSLPLNLGHCSFYSSPATSMWGRPRVKIGKRTPCSTNILKFFIMGLMKQFNQLET